MRVFYCPRAAAIPGAPRTPSKVAVTQVSPTPGRCQSMKRSRRKSSFVIASTRSAVAAITMQATPTKIGSNQTDDQATASPAHPRARAPTRERWSPSWSRYTGRETMVRVTYKSDGGTWGLPADLCVMSIAPLTPWEAGSLAYSEHHGGEAAQDDDLARWRSER